MTTVDATGAPTGELDLPEEIFGLAPHRAVLHRAVVTEMASARAGTHATRTRGMVRGGGRKPWRQKGTGRARHGSRRSPLWVGGAITFGPRPQDYSPKQNRQERALALRSALSAQVRAGRVTVVDPSATDRPRTATVAALLRALGAEGGAVIVTGAGDATLARAAANVRGARVLAARRLTVRHLLLPRPMLITRGALTELQEVLAP
ncbi:MAG: 50S ribosomal protein L4 [Armatimonadetes bacterium]|nr:50S ribosomal protein L4 [Armatimonadota bacterium]